MKAQLEEMRVESEQAKKTVQDGNSKVKELEYKIKNAKQLKEKELKV